ncbi:MAG: hypothetical protein ACR2NB_13830 [Solirubrobacteraceae bacterium]
MRTPLATLLAFGLIAAPAAAQATATATPNQAGKGAKVHLDLDGTRPPVSGRVPTATTLSIQAGYRFDAKAVANRCTPDQAKSDACPAGSRAGTATVVATYAGMTFTVPLRLFLVKPQRPGDLAGVAAVATVLGAPQSAVGRVVRTTAAPFGLQVLLPTPSDLSSYPVTLRSFKADVGAHRTVTVGRRKRRHKVRHDLITNPKTCSGTWAAQAAFTFSDGSTGTLDAPIACRS